MPTFISQEEVELSNWGVLLKTDEAIFNALCVLQKNNKILILIKIS